MSSGFSSFLGIWFGGAGKPIGQPAVGGGAFQADAFDDGFQIVRESVAGTAHPVGVSAIAIENNATATGAAVAIVHGVHATARVHNPKHRELGGGIAWPYPELSTRHWSAP